MDKQFTYKVFPAQNKRKLAIFIVSILLTCALSYIAGGVFWMIFGLILLLIVLYPFYVTTTYTIDDNGIHIKRPLNKKVVPWSRIKKLRKLKNGILLSPYEKDTFWDRLSGFFILANENQKNQIIKIADEFLKNNSTLKTR